MTQAYRLEDRYTHDDGSVFLSGIQALARLPIEQLRVDRAQGHNTAAFISGYQGSPLGGFDQEMARAAGFVPDLPIVCRPAVNEELAATAVMGSQLAATRPDARYDGVVGLWYGKAPGLDRACDALRHAVFAGTSPLGGAVAIVGDDPAAKSSTLPSSSDATLVDLHMPIVYPSDVQEALDLGRHAIALSRASGLWAGLKIEASVADGTATIDLNPNRIEPVMPLIDGERYECTPDAMLLSAHSLEVEHELRGIRSEIAVRYAAENQMNRITVDPPDPWIGLIASGYTYREMLEALRRLGLESREAIADAGIRIIKMSMPIPFDPRTIRNFARGLEEIFVVEEMNPTLERWVREALYPQAERPLITGKHDHEGRPLLPTDGMLDADRMIDGLRRRLAPRLGDRIAPATPERELIPLAVARSPYFCSGCPHNQSTRVPEGSLVGAGIGCHTMALLVDDERIGDIVGVAAMGNEGAAWIGMSEFVETNHLFQNIGDGTFFHSGQLAVQAAIAAGVDITYKILFNGTVAMTGGQDPQGGRGIPQVVQLLKAYGVERMLVTTDDLSRYDYVDFPSGVDVWDRSRLIEAQDTLAAVPGVTVLIHDQACAAEVRRKRKRGLAPTPKTRIAINPRICEGCGDCGRASSCLSVEPADTPFGRKTQINQDTCNLDYSCLDGDCPSFMTVVPARGRTTALFRKLRRRSREPLREAQAIPDPPVFATTGTWSIRMAGVGGTGVVTAAQIIGTAAMLSGRHVSGLDQTGLSQKAGPVISDLRMTLDAASPPPSNHLGDQQADALIGFDQLVAASAKSLEAAAPGRTLVVGSNSASPTGAMIIDPEIAAPQPGRLAERIASTTAGPGHWFDAGHLAEVLIGSSVGANIMVVGAAVQAGAIQIEPHHVEEAIRLNGVAVEANLAAFNWGRYAVADPDYVAAAAATATDSGGPVDAALSQQAGDIAATVATPELADDFARFAADLVAYQDMSYARGYLADLQQVAVAEAAAQPGSSLLTCAVADSLYHLLAYKDEYEVARLMVDDAGLASVAEAIDGPIKARWQLHPPILRSMGMDRKIAIPTWLSPGVRLLAKGKRIRGSKLDLFGYAEVRKIERAMIPEYRAGLGQLVAVLSSDNLAAAVRVAALPQEIRGYEHLKVERAATARAALAEGLAEISAATGPA